MTYQRWERIVFRVTGRWPQTVVGRRLAESDARPRFSLEDLTRLAVEEMRDPMGRRRGKDPVLAMALREPVLQGRDHLLQAADARADQTRKIVEALDREASYGAAADFVEREFGS